ncbi:glycosyltransferase family 2 protein [Paracoccus sp. SCSIO 75233]|uniref:glycosyltransferase family 2 protein n=1 Tax=Paracoccus sp. SCSIO 75233 TaxID=3017782 RepID=UPI0022F0F890|nr:glycosyltransferase family 2 protein [Paracoccus sp. SCSIO 75233]WBU55262.1 glycosyltransferase family 2 protein [Paracoccus sp. SCSIO 75233]
MQPILRRTIIARSLREMNGGSGPEGELIAAHPAGEFGRLYFRDTPDLGLLLPEGQGGVMWSRVVSDAPTMTVRLNSDGTAPLPIRDMTASAALDPDETGIFAGRNVLLGKRSRETAEVVLDWLRWHRSHHRADAALILDRGPPAETDGFAADLAALIRADETAELAGMTLMVVGFDRPMGAADHGPEWHPLYAPDSPGKDRMDPPEPDPWYAPLGYRLTFDLMRQRFLGEARAVVNLEVMDLLAIPEGEGTIFDQALASETGFLLIRGQRAYPWSLRKDTEPGFGDHICLRFDAPPRDSRWCVAPAALPQGAIWMWVRILGPAPQLSPTMFTRCMALRFARPGSASVGQIVPKTSLVEDEALLARSALFGADPMRQPKELPPEALAVQNGAASGNRVAIVTTMKNEGPFILEWIAYHRAIGIEDFLIYTNDCTDGTDSFLQLLARKGICEWRENPFREVQMKPQHAALDAANDEAMVKAADWVICMDVDEYIAVHTGDHTMKSLFAAVPDANMISLTWRLYGNNDIDKFEDGFITQSFTRAAREFANKPHQAWGFKTLCRNAGLFKKLGVHRPKGLLPTAVDRINWVNGSGRPMPQNQWRNAWRSHSGTYGYDLVSLNHYAVRSAESFLVKRDRGRVNHVDRDQGMAYWFRMNHNVVEDRRMQQILPILQAEFDRLMADPEIRAAHEGCVAAHAAKIKELKAQPKYQAFHQELIGARLRKLSRLHGHFGANVYLAGPGVVPDEIVAREPDEEFFFTVEHAGDTQH